MTTTLSDLVARWRSRAEELRAYGAEPQAITCEQLLVELETALDGAGSITRESDRGDRVVDDYTVGTLSSELGKARSTITGWLQEGLIPEAYKLRGVEWRIPRAAARAFLDRQPKPLPRRPRRSQERLAARGDLSRWRRKPRRQATRA